MPSGRDVGKSVLWSLRPLQRPGTFACIFLGAFNLHSYDFVVVPKKILAAEHRFHAQLRFLVTCVRSCNACSCGCSSPFLGISAKCF